MTANRIRLPVAAGVGGVAFLSFVYLGIVTLAESPQHAVELFWQDRLIVLPIILGFGVQMGLYVTLKMKLFVPFVPMAAHSGALTGASGVTSAAAMVACCAHHVTDVLPILGLTAATAFLAEYKTAFMLVGLSMTYIGILVMIVILFKERRKAFQHMQSAVEAI